LNLEQAFVETALLTWLSAVKVNGRAQVCSTVSQQSFMPRL